MITAVKRNNTAIIIELLVLINVVAISATAVFVTAVLE